MDPARGRAQPNNREFTGWANPPDQIGSALDDLFSPILLEVKR
jgi:hypothetical protein